MSIASVAVGGARKLGHALLVQRERARSAADRGRAGSADLTHVLHRRAVLDRDCVAAESIHNLRELQAWCQGECLALGGVWRADSEIFVPQEGVDPCDWGAVSSRPASSRFGAKHEFYPP